MTEKITGTVQAVSQQENRFGIRLDDNVWYNGWGICAVEKGDKVELEVEKVEKGNRVFYNIKSAKKIEEPVEKQKTIAEVPVESTMIKTKDEEKNRRCALIQAVNFVMAVHKTENMDRGELVDLIMSYAKAFENYIKG